ncbi:MAG: hypothetical protein ABI134_19315 [Byssovorax sp.]
MTTARTPWHVYFAMFMKEIAPPGVEVTFEVTLTTEPQRGDLLLLHREDVPRRDSDAQAFLGLWPLLRTDTLVEFKSLAWTLKKGDLARLQGYGAQYFSAQIDRPLALRDLALVLILPTRTPTLVEELARMSWRAISLGNGYDRIEGAGYSLYVAIMAEITEAEQDGLLGLFSERKWTRTQITWWWQHRTGSMEGTNMQDMPGVDEIIQQMLDSLPPEQRIAGLAPEERLTDLAPAQQILALSNDVLRTLPSDYLRTLPADVQESIRRRIGTKSTP